ncbi:MAG: retroviral-like aspartic protease family protein [Planctomycetes bacterium]|nr:retroviral-like aspartic protease family protein [Planctomycetota bacterium]
MQRSRSTIRRHADLQVGRGSAWIGAATLVVAVLVAALVAPGCATDRPFDARRRSRPVPLEGAVVEVPVSVAQGVVLVPTLVDGRGPFWFALDTGSTTVVISEKVAEAVGVRVENRTGSIVTESGRRDGKIVQADLREVRVGQASFRRVGALVADLDGLSRGVGRPLDGILGMPVLVDHLWTIDTGHSLLRIEEGTLPAEPPTGVIAGNIAGDTTETLALVLDGGLPTLRIDVAGRTMNAIVDTGQRMAISVGPDDAGPLRTDLRVIGESVGQVLDGEVRRDVARLDGDVRISPSVVLRAPPVLLGRATRIGMAAFEGRVLTFDLGHLRMRVSK